MSNAGRNPVFEKILADSAERIRKKLNFLGPDKDPLLYVDSLVLKMKSENGKILFTDKAGDIKYCPCITKFVSFADPSIKFPKDKKRNMFECAKIQYVMCQRVKADIPIDNIQGKVASFQCNCKDCYKIAIQGIFAGNQLCL